MSKLLVVTFFVAILGFAIASCPHPTFLKRHLCTTCGNSQAEAEAFALKAHKLRPSPTSKASIFIANAMTYTFNAAENLCVFKTVAPKYVCFPRQGTNYQQWDCKLKDKVIATHSGQNGHYFYGNDTYA